MKQLPQQFHRLLEEFVTHVHINALPPKQHEAASTFSSSTSRLSNKDSNRSSVSLPILLLSYSIAKENTSVLAELRPWKGSSHDYRRIDLYINGQKYHFGIELASGISGPQFIKYLKRTERYRRWVRRVQFHSKS
ncbi:hypothetical protein QOT17_021323 [Balamuthia mandrillaris]